MEEEDRERYFVNDNHALLAGEVSGALWNYFHCELEKDEEKNYTGRTLIHRHSGIWAVRVDPVAIKDDDESAEMDKRDGDGHDEAS